MAKVRDAVMADLDKEIKRIEKEVRNVIFNGVGLAVDLTTRVDTGFLKNSWYFDLKEPTGPEDKRPEFASFFIGRDSLSLANLAKWGIGQPGYIINNVEYASFHDLGTAYIRPLFISFQVETTIDRQLSRIR